MKFSTNMKLHLLVVIVTLSLTTVFAEEGWSWNAKDEKSIIQKRSDNVTDVEKDDQKVKSDDEKIADQTQGRFSYSKDEIYSNDTELNSIIEEILSGSREGRALDGYDEVYTDPLVQEALQSGDDNQARNLIKDKLCTLGLLSCETEGKRPFYSTIYAQGGPRPPFPPGRRPIGGPPYGAPKPMPQPGKFGPPRKVGYEGPFLNKPYITNRPPGPIYPGSYVDSNDNGLTYTKPPLGAIIYGSKPPPGAVYTGGDAPYNFEHIVGDKIHVEDHHSGGSFGGFGGSHLLTPSASIVGSSASFGSSGSSFGSHSKPLLAGAVAAAENPLAEASSQTHVHHHYHHIEGEQSSAKQQPTVLTVPVPVPVPTGNGISSQFAVNSQSSSFTPSVGFVGNQQGSAAFNAGFNGASQGSLLTGALNSVGIKPVSEGLSGFGGSNYDQQQNYYGGGSGSGANYQNSVASSGANYQNFVGSGGANYQNSDYYKKDLYSNKEYLNGLSSGQPNKYSQSNYDYQAFETARQQNIDCTCVPAHQCSAADRIGRKDDLILPLDPRNLATDIEALENNSTIATTVDYNKNDDEESKKVKRETEIEGKSKQSDDNTAEESTEAQARQRQRIRADNNNRQNINNNNNNNYDDDYDSYPAYPSSASSTHFGVRRRKILPTFGVSFGLPFPGGYGYPFNAVGGGHPGQNPYFGAIGPNGLSLGLINVSPLVSLQVQKHENGEKIVKPLVNLHVTPSVNLVNTVGELFKQKKQEILYNQHVHSHTHIGPPPPEIYHPHHEHHQHHQYPEYPQYPQYPQYHQQHHPEHFQYGFPSGSPANPTFSAPGLEYPQVPIGPIRPIGPIFNQAPGELVAGFNNGYQPQFIPPQHELGFDPYSRSYNITNNLRVSKNLVRFNDDVTGTGYAGNYNYSPFNLPVDGQDKLGKDIHNVEENYHQSNRLGKGISFNKNIDNSYKSIPTPAPGQNQGGDHITFPNDRRKKRSLSSKNEKESISLQYFGKEDKKLEKRQSYLGQRPGNNIPPYQQCRGNEVCCRRPYRQPHQQQLGKCGVRNAHGINGRIKNPVYVDGDSEFGEYPWQAAILKKDPKESVYVCGGTLIDHQHIVTAAHCVKTYQGFDLRVRLGEWDVNHDVEFFPYIERDVVSVTVHPEYYAGTLDNDLAILKLDYPIELNKYQHISPACLPDKFSDFTGARCWTTGWGKDAFGDFGKYQNILKEVDVPILSHQQCQHQLRQTRLGYQYNLNPGFVCAGGEEGKDACKGDGGGPMVCERGGSWHLVGVVSWGIGCGQVNVPGVYVKVSHYLDWIAQVTRY